MDWSGGNRKALRIFLADRAESVGEQVRDWARSSNGWFSVEAFRSSHQLLRRFACERPDLVLLDLTMEGMDGLTALRALAPSGVPAVMLSEPTAEGARAAMEALIGGASDCLLKTRMRGHERIALAPREFTRRLSRAMVASDGTPPCGRGERQIWRTVEIDDRGQVVAGRPTADPFPRRFWVGLTFVPPRCLGRMVRSLAEAPERPLGGMLLETGLPPRFSRALAEAATRHWNRAVLEMRDGEVLRPGQWRVVPGSHLVRLSGGTRQSPRVALAPGRHPRENDGLVRQIELLLDASPDHVRLYLFEQPDPGSREALERLIAAGGTVLLQGRGASVLRFERREEAVHEGEGHACGSHRRVA